MPAYYVNKRQYPINSRVGEFFIQYFTKSGMDDYRLRLALFEGIRDC
jgi:hypothetical protein